MPKIKIINGFPSLEGSGPLLTGYQLQGTIKIGDKIIINKDIKVPIIEIIIIPGELLTREIIGIRIPVEYENRITWHSYYGNEFEIET